MNYVRSRKIGIFLLCCSAFAIQVAHAENTGLGAAQGYNLFVFNNLNMQADVTGAVAFGGVLTGNLTVGSSLPSNQVTLVADGTNAGGNNVLGGGAGLNLNGGSGAYIKGYSTSNHPNININQGTILSSNPIAGGVAGTQASLVSLAQSLTSLGTGSGTSGVIDTTGSNCTSCVVNLNNFSNLTSIKYSAGQTVIIDVLGVGANSTSSPTTQYTVNGNFPGNSGGNESTVANNILFNFGSAQSVSLAGQLYGSILAPSATVTGSGQIVDGEIIANNVSGLGETHAGSMFAGDAPSATPEPATAFLLGGALVGVGLQLKRRVKTNPDAVKS